MSNDLQMSKQEKVNLHCLVAVETKEKVIKYAKDNNLDTVSQAVRILLEKGLESDKPK
ncbi:regulator [Macrococcus armenti]|uniref:regulator n=1 Tax=Macrococcus armenti TaxID=2875764 RepID=UPI001CCADF61|nr:regulator [Macrococcus armenti]UBH09785.1 regulator [Macrococcus armenti]